MLVFKRNQIVITALIVVILCAGYLNFRYNKAKLTSVNTEAPIGTAYFVDNSKNQDASSTENLPVAKINGDYFIVTRAEKEKTRDEQKEMLNNIVNNKNSSKEAKTKAEAELLKLTKNVEKEMIIEGVLKGKGFSDILAFINDNKIDIIVKDDTNILPSQQAMILDIVTRETGISAENVKISPYKKNQSEENKG